MNANPDTLRPAAPASEPGVTCAQCRFFVIQDSATHGKSTGLGQCHRHPPVFAGDSSPKEVHHWRFPLVSSQAWCGEHRIHADGSYHYNTPLHAVR